MPRAATSNQMGGDLRIKRVGQLTGAVSPDHFDPPAFASDSLAESFGSRQNREMKVNMDDVMSMGAGFSYTDGGKGKNKDDCVIEMTNAMNTERAMIGGRDGDPNQ